MNKLKLIRVTIDTFGILIIVGISIVIVLFVTLPKGEFIEIGNPYLEITSSELTKQISDVLPETDPNVKLSAKTLQISLPINIEIRVLIIAFALVTSVYIGYLLTIIKKIAIDVENKIPFNLSNIKRIKRIGILVTMAPVAEWILQAIFSLWIRSHFQFEGLKLISTSNLGLPILFLGLLVIVLGVAFEHGQKIQEENELTV